MSMTTRNLGSRPRIGCPGCPSGSLLAVAVLTLALVCAGETVGATQSAAAAFTAFNRANTLVQLMEGRAGVIGADRALDLVFTAYWSSPLDRKQGAATIRAHAVVTNGFLAIELTYTYDHGPVYEDPHVTRLAFGGPADAGGEDATVWRTDKESIVFSRQRNEDLRDLMRYKVRPDNSIAAQHASSALERGRIGNRELIHLFDNFLLAMGRMPDSYVTRFTEVAAPSADGLEAVEAVGTAGGSGVGEWSLRVDPKLGYLVRAASFTYAGEQRPLIRAINSGYVACEGLVLAASGGWGLLGARPVFQLLDLRNLPRSDQRVASFVSRIVGRVSRGGHFTLDERGPTLKFVHPK